MQAPVLTSFYAALAIDHNPAAWQCHWFLMIAVGVGRAPAASPWMPLVAPIAAQNTKKYGASFLDRIEKAEDST